MLPRRLRAARVLVVLGEPSPRSVHSPKAMNAIAATIVIGSVGSAAPSAAPMSTDTACTSAVAPVMPISTGTTR